ncbi:hypothetical protein [Pseudomonas phage PA1C]|uniref:Uncharacterized protein n=1 Tax=Pseudomonas phage vB_PaeM_PS119XW TaxID=2601632 RepID=A0A5C1K7Z4_9CAUD|nr:hypothetical protein PP933_gp160 [Pseudomonas phage vB_PaeM_PS119XW]QBX32316.1 hypothetical protein [Pseudomonas phage PA1C]QEM41889.1 hypothetical protein [Pseudomonas phage vB_PaeM_PS119XW]BEG72404.1 hypothetical protein RVBP21_0320 [Pseudomonas phage BRkr]
MFDFHNVPEPEKGRKPVVLCFNRLNGKFIVATSMTIDQCDPDNPNVIYVEDNMDLFNGDRVVGDLTINDDGTWEKNYSILGENEGPRLIYEAQLDNQMAYKITQRYPVVEQVNVLGRAIVALAEKTGLELTELSEMLDYIKLCKDTSRNHKEFYQNDPNYEYITNEQEAEDRAATFEGGLHELIGPRNIEGGRVFATS